MNHVEKVEAAQVSSSRPFISRRKVLGVLGGATMLSAAGLSRFALPIYGQGEATSDFDILNFALNLEYLEAEFYTYAVTGRGIESIGIATDGQGTAGPTAGGKKVEFTDPILRRVAEELAFDEQQHVKLLRSVLGQKAIAKPALNLGALGMGFGSEAEYLVMGRAMEDTGVSAYGGAAPLIKSKEILGVSARILADEAYHMGNVRLLIAQKNIQTKPVDGKDILPPPSGKKFFAVDNNALSVVRTTAEVMPIVKPFYPNGLNGAIK